MDRGKPTPDETHDAGLRWAIRWLGLRADPGKGPYHAVDAAGARYRISGRIDRDDVHVSVGSARAADYDWLVVVRFDGTLSTVHNVWKIESNAVDRAVNPSGQVALGPKLLAGGVTMLLGIRADDIS
jgi:hypothetical protein